MKLEHIAYEVGITAPAFPVPAQIGKLSDLQRCALLVAPQNDEDQILQLVAVDLVRYRGVHVDEITVNNRLTRLQVTLQLLQVWALGLVLKHVLVVMVNQLGECKFLGLQVCVLGICGAHLCHALDHVGQSRFPYRSVVV